MNSQYCIILCSCPDEATARDISQTILEKHFAACIQYHQITSMYHWKGSIAKENEYLLSIKTKKNNYAKIESCIKQLHPYEIPEIIEIPIIQGLPSYLQWIDDSSS